MVSDDNKLLSVHQGSCAYQCYFKKGCICTEINTDSGTQITIINVVYTLLTHTRVNVTNLRFTL